MLTIILWDFIRICFIHVVLSWTLSCLGYLSMLLISFYSWWSRSSPDCCSGTQTGLHVSACWSILVLGRKWRTLGAVISEKPCIPDLFSRVSIDPSVIALVTVSIPFLMCDHLMKFYLALLGLKFYKDRGNGNFHLPA